MVKPSSSSSLEEVGLKRGPWTPEEDHKLISYILKHGHGTWCSLPEKTGVRRCGKSCRLRWINYLRPDIRRGKFSFKEDQTIIQLHALLGNKWSAIAACLPKRTDNDIKNYWNTHLKKRLAKMGIDPTTHRPINDVVKDPSSHLTHMAQWETARLQAEARLVKQSKLGSSSSQLPPLTRLVLTRITTTLAQPSPPPPCLDVLKVWQNYSLSTSSKPSSTTTPTTAVNSPKMNCLYAMMLATDDLESSTSTLSLPTHSDVVTNRNIITDGHSNQSLLIPSSSTTVVGDNDIKGMMKGSAGDGTEAWANKARNLGDDDIMAVVEAFRSGGGRGHTENCTDMEVLRDDVMVENSTPGNMGIFNVNECVGSIQEKCYWNNMLNDLPEFERL